MGLDIDSSRGRGAADANITAAGDQGEIGTGVCRGADPAHIMGGAQDPNFAGRDIAARRAGGDIGQGPGIGAEAAIVQRIGGDQHVREGDIAPLNPCIDGEIGRGLDLPITAGGLLRAQRREVKRARDLDIAVTRRCQPGLKNGVDIGAAAAIAGDGIGQQRHRPGDVDVAPCPDREIGTAGGRMTPWRRPEG